MIVQNDRVNLFDFERYHFLLSLPLFASLSFTSPLSESDEAMLSSFFSSAISGRSDADIIVTSFLRDDGYIRLSFTVDGKERVLSAADEEELAIFIENAFSLEELVFLDGSTLFYVTDDIIASHDSYGVGTLVEAVDSSGRTRALMEVTDSDGAINLYSTIYEKDLVAGLNLRRGPSFSIALRALSMIPPSSFAFALDFSYLPLFAYFNPVVSLLISYDGLLSYYGGLGIEARFPLERLIRTHFTLIEDASIGASAMLYLGYDGAFSVGADFSAFYEHHISSRTYWRLGYETGTMINNAIMLSFGVLL